MSNEFPDQPIPNDDSAKNNKGNKSGRMWQVMSIVLLATSITLAALYALAPTKALEYNDAQKDRVLEGYIFADYFCHDQNLKGFLDRTDAKNTEWQGGFKLSTTVQCYLTDGGKKEYTVTSDQQTMELKICEVESGDCINERRIGEPLGPETPT